MTRRAPAAPTAPDAVDQDGLFDAEPAVPPPFKHKPAMPPGRVSWLRVTAQGTRCDDCMALHTHGPAPLAMAARWRRMQGGVDRLLCGAHAQDWRRTDGHKHLPGENDQ